MQINFNNKYISCFMDVVILLYWNFRQSELKSATPFFFPPCLRGHSLANAVLINTIHIPSYVIHSGRKVNINDSFSVLILRRYIEVKWFASLEWNLLLLAIAQ